MKPRRSADTRYGGGSDLLRAGELPMSGLLGCSEASSLLGLELVGLVGGIGAQSKERF